MSNRPKKAQLKTVCDRFEYHKIGDEMGYKGIVRWAGKIFALHQRRHKNTVIDRLQHEYLGLIDIKKAELQNIDLQCRTLQLHLRQSEEIVKRLQGILFSMEETRKLILTGLRSLPRSVDAQRAQHAGYLEQVCLETQKVIAIQEQILAQLTSRTQNKMREVSSLHKWAKKVAQENKRLFREMTKKGPPHRG